LKNNDSFFVDEVGRTSQENVLQCGRQLKVSFH